MTVFNRGEETTYWFELSGDSKIQQFKNWDSTVFLCRGKVLITGKIFRTNGVMNYMYPGCKRFYISFLFEAMTPLSYIISDRYKNEMKV